MNLKNCRSALVFLLVGFLFSSALLAENNPEFQSYCDSLKKYVDESRFEAAAALLPSLDSLAKINKTPEQEADLLYYKGYYSLFNAGNLETHQLFTNAAKTYNELGLQQKRNLCEVQLAVNLYFLGRYQECLAAAEKLLKTISSQEEETRGTAHNLAAAVYGGSDGVPEKAIYHCEQAIPYFKKVKDYRRLISLYGILTACANQQEEYPYALANIDSAAHYAIKANNQQQMAFLNIRRGRALLNLDKGVEAFSAFRKAESYYQEHGSKRGELSWIYSIFRTYYIDQNDYKSAYKYILLNDSLAIIKRADENNKALNELMVQYETEKKVQQIKVQELTIAYERQRNQQLLLTAIGGLSLLVLLFALGYFYYRNRQQEKLRNTQIQYQKQLLEATINTQEAERKRISRDLHDGIGQQLSGLKLSFQQLSEKVQNIAPNQSEGLQKLQNILSDTSIEVRDLSHQMMPKALQEFGLTKAIADMLDKSLPPGNITYQFEHFGLEDRLPEQVEIGIYRISQELINNIIKHSGAKEVDLQLMYNKKQLVLIVEDDGRGFKPNESQTNGHGLTNIRSRLQAINGELHFENADKTGTIATIRVAVNPQV